MVKIKPAKVEKVAKKQESSKWKKAFYILLIIVIIGLLVAAVFFAINKYNSLKKGDTNQNVTTKSANNTLNENIIATEMHTLSVYLSGNGFGDIISTPEGINCSMENPECQKEYPSGTTVTLEATPSQGSIFEDWSGACTGTETCTIIINADTEAIANFKATTIEEITVPPTAIENESIIEEETINYRLTVEKEGSGSGIISSDPEGIECGDTCSHLYPEDTIVSLNALTEGWSLFREWNGCDTVEGLRCEVLIRNSRTVKANFRSFYMFQLNIEGSGRATLRSIIDGVEEEAVCVGGEVCAGPILEGATIEISAEPLEGYQFKEWGGDCSSFGPEADCTIVMNSNKTADATFEKKKFLLTLNKNGAGDAKIVSNPYGIQCEAGCRTKNAQFDYGTLVNLAITEFYGGAILGGWSDDCAGAGAVLSCNINMTSDKIAGVTLLRP